MSKFSKLVQKQKNKQEAKKKRINIEATTNANRVGLICACGSKKSYKVCCGVFHQNIHNAKLPLEIMKSRYTAYVIGNIDYLLQSHHSSTQPIQEATEILNWSQSVTWLGLEIVSAPLPKLDVGYVTFKANYIENGVAKTIHEISRFIKENGCWVYLDGKHY